MRKAAIYARYSSDNQREESIEAQVRAIKEYCAREGIEIVATYIDEARSATTDERPEFLRMIRESKAGLWDMVIVHKLDRFARNRYDSAFYKRELKKSGVKLVSVLEHLDDSPEAIILESVLEGMAEYYSRNLAREVMKGMLENAHQARFCGGIPPLGYDIRDGKYVINEQEARWVRLIFEMYAAGKTYSQILDELSRAGARTKHGKPFGKNSLHAILRNERYCGVYVFNKGSKRAHNIEKDDVVKVEGGVPAIISHELYKMAQARLKSRSTRARYKAKETYLLSGRIFCGECGGAMVGNRAHRSDGRVFSYYECANKKRTKSCSMRRVSRQNVESEVLQVLRKQILNDQAIPELARRVSEYYQASRQDLEDEKKYLREELAKLNIKNERLLNAIEEGGYNPIIARRLEENAQAAEMYRRRLSELEMFREQVVTEDHLRAYLSTFLRAVEKESTDGLKEAISAFVEKVTVYRDHVEVRLKINPAKLGLDTVGSGEGTRTPDTAGMNRML